MAANPGHSLPTIPSLPPIEMHETSVEKFAANHSSEPFSPFLPHSSPSLTSRDSMSTAYTSSILGSPTASHEFTPSVYPHSFVAPHSLRKSISVDSFVSHERDSVTKNSGTRLHRGNTYSAIESPFNGLDSIVKAYPDQRSTHISSRGRGASTSTMGDDFNYPMMEEIEFEPWRPSDGGRRVSIKGKEQDRLSVRPGDLNLPPRGTASNSGSQMAATVVPREESRRLHAAASMQSFHVRGTFSTSDAAGRARSGSLGVHSHSKGNILADTSFMYNQIIDLSIAVIGAPGCGKSTIIRTDACTHGLSQLDVSFAPPGSSGAHTSFHYTRRMPLLTQNEDPVCLPLHIFEIDVSRIHSLPRVDGLLMCYDASSESSFAQVEKALCALRPLNLPTVGLACKSDLKLAVSPRVAADVFRRFDIGLIEVTNTRDEGTAKMRRSFDWLLRSVVLARSASRIGSRTDRRNPASPQALVSPPWDVSEPSSATPTAAHLANPGRVGSEVQVPVRHVPPHLVPTSSNSPHTRLPSNALPELERSPSADTQSEQKQSRVRNLNNGGPGGSASTSSLSPPGSSHGETMIVPEQDDAPEKKGQESRPSQFVTLEELLDKLMFLTVSGDDPTFIHNFLLTYRRFATPRNILLAMQKRMRSLDRSSSDPMFACYAQMRICHLLETWIRSYPHDFAVPGSSGALNALVKSILAKTYLLHYAAELLSFLERLPNLEDKDASWALKSEDVTDDNDDAYRPFEDEDEPRNSEPESPRTDLFALPPSSENFTLAPAVARERKPSLALGAQVAAISPAVQNAHTDSQMTTPKQLLKDLLRAAGELQNCDSEEVAQEITRHESELFMKIEPRHWLQYTLTSGKKDPDSDSISRYNHLSNNLGSWVASLILCHDKPKQRARQIEKFVDIAGKLRTHNNYSALRAFVAGINNSTYPTDATMEIFKSKSPEHYKYLLSWDVLFQHRGGHQAYRMALKNTSGPCIPALEVHMSDLIRAHEGNPDFSPNDPTKIHWAKFNLFGKFIQSTTQCQIQCRSTTGYQFPIRGHVRRCVFLDNLMSGEMQDARLDPAPDIDLGDSYRPSIPKTVSREHSPFTQGRDGTFIRRIFQW